LNKTKFSLIIVLGGKLERWKAEKEVDVLAEVDSDFGELMVL
jgi:hypothetical protein